MGKSNIMHIDEAPLLWGQPRRTDGIFVTGSQFIGDIDTDPWVYINSMEPNSAVETYSHTVDEVICVVEGSLTIGGLTCGPGAVMAIEKDTEYEFTAGPEGVRFLNIRPGLDAGPGAAVRSG